MGRKGNNSAELITPYILFSNWVIAFTTGLENEGKLHTKAGQEQSGQKSHLWKIMA